MSFQHQVKFGHAFNSPSRRSMNVEFEFDHSSTNTTSNLSSRPTLKGRIHHLANVHIFGSSIDYEHNLDPESKLLESLSQNSSSDYGRANSRMARQSIFIIRGGLRSLWATRQTEDISSSDSDRQAKIALRELVTHLAFLTVLCIISASLITDIMFYQHNLMKNLFLNAKDSSEGNFLNVKTVEKFWKFVRGPLLDGLYDDYSNNSQESLPTAENSFISKNKLLGVPRIRQVKVHNQSCQIYEDFANYISECYDSYSPSSEDKEPFGPQNGTAWQYSSESQLGGIVHWGYFGTYSSGGFYVDLSPSKAESAKIIQLLFDNDWIRRGTRAVFVDFSVYNANINLFCITRLLVEFPATGGVFPSWSFDVVKLTHYGTYWDYFIFMSEIIFFIFIVYYTVEEILEIKKHRFEYFKHFGNFLDVIQLVISFVCSIFNVYRIRQVSGKLVLLLQEPTKFNDFERMSYWETMFNNAVALTIFLAWFKILKYTSFNQTMSVLSNTLDRSAKDFLSGLFVPFIIIFMTFSILGYMIFGTEVENFSTLEKSCYTLFRLILGNLEFYQMRDANFILGPIYFVLFVFFVFFVLTRIFLAIVTDIYYQVRQHHANLTNHTHMFEFIKKTCARETVCVTFILFIFVLSVTGVLLTHLRPK